MDNEAAAAGLEAALELSTIHARAARAVAKKCEADGARYLAIAFVNFAEMIELHAAKTRQLLNEGKDNK